MKKEFKINTEIYSEENISEALVDFKEVGEITFDNGNIVISGEDDDEIIEIFNELMNYIASLVNE